MIQRLQKRPQGEGGFTLVELLVVIVILGVLASIVVFAVGGITNNSSKSACSTDKATVSSAEEAYFAQNGTYTAMGTLTSSNLLHADSKFVTVALAPATAPFTSYTIGYVAPNTALTCP